MDLKETLGEEVMRDVTAVRPTSYGGHLIIFCSESGRNKAMAIMRQNKEERGVEEKNSCIIAPMKKFSKIVCREPPDFYSPEIVLSEMYKKQNPYLQSIPLNCREARIFTTRLGWIFEISALEAAAIQAQNNRLSYGYGREMRVEEFIPL